MNVNEIRQVLAHGPGCMDEAQYHETAKKLLGAYDEMDLLVSKYMRTTNAAIHEAQKLARWKAEHLMSVSSREALKAAADIGLLRGFTLIREALAHPSFVAASQQASPHDVLKLILETIDETIAAGLEGLAS